MRLLPLLACCVAGLCVASAQEAACADCTPAQYWQIDPDYYRGGGGPPPEASDPQLAARADVGVAFSGGGTRSAAATVGQLRGLQANGWLERIRYISSVSGGSWAAVPFVYSRFDAATLLGTGLRPESMETVPEGLLADRIVSSGLAHVGLQESLQFIPDEIGGYDVTTIRDTFQIARDVIRKVRGRDVPEADRRNKAYAHMLGQVFLQGVVDDGPRKPYAWKASTLGAGAPGGNGLALSSDQFITVPGDRPFLVVNGTLIRDGGDDYPQLIPVEYTPLYTGARQRFGAVGGTYVAPWAYDRLVVGEGSGEFLIASPGPTQRPFTLADVIASSGAAPQLTMLIGNVPERVRNAVRTAADAFPAFRAFAVRPSGISPVTEELPHGDGGFTDNLGVMPLLARGVRNIIVFVNANTVPERNAQLQSYFMRVNQRDGGGDKTLNAVFNPANYELLLDAFRTAERQGTVAAACGTDWDVRPNAVYNIRQYRVNICWIYNQSAAAWERTLPPVLRQWLDEARNPRIEKKSVQARQLERFPRYATFGENKPRVIKLTALQTNVLADLGAWSVTSDGAADVIVRAFDGALARPRPR